MIVLRCDAGEISTGDDKKMWEMSSDEFGCLEDIHDGAIIFANGLIKSIAHVDSGEEKLEEEFLLDGYASAIGQVGIMAIVTIPATVLKRISMTRKL